MWKLLRTHEDSAALAAEAMSLMEHTSRRIIVTTSAVGLAAQLLLGVFAAERQALMVFAAMVVLGVTSYVSFQWISKHFGMAQFIWQVGLASVVALLVLLLGRPEVALLLTLLPLMGSVSMGWHGAALSETLMTVTILLLWKSNLLAQPLTGAHIWSILLGGAFSGLIGAVASQSLYVVTQWSLESFDEARESRDDARQSRAQLARALQDLDRAYYRLERTNAALIALSRASAEAERFKAEFATTLSHELRTPLGLIIGFADMMLTAPQKYGGIEIPQAYRTDLNAIYQNAHHLEALVNDVLDLSRIEAGSLVLAREETDLDSLVTEAVAMVEDYVTAKGLELVVEIEPGLPRISVDTLRIHQVLLNLLVNAARFTESGWIRLDVTGQAEQIRLRVTDTGRGIPEQELSRVFEQFRQVQPGHSIGWLSGSGLGLPISKTLVELHGGAMGVESTYLKGTSFWFDLPVDSEKSGGEAQRLPRAVRTRSIGGIPAAKRLIVVAHEDPGVISLLQRYLSDYRLIGARDAIEAAELAREVGAIAMLAGTPLPSESRQDDLIRVSCPLPSSRDTARLFGAQDMLVKPVTDADLWRAIDAVKPDARHVVVVDDDLDMTRLLRRMLNPRIPDACCVEANDGAEGLRLIREQQPDLVLLDLALPELSGEEILASLHSDERTKHIPVIIVSAREQHEVEPELLGQLHISRGRGMRLGEFTRVLAASLRALAPGWH